MKNKLISALDYHAKPIATLQKLECHQTRLLAWILRFVILFCIITLLIILILNPNHDPSSLQYEILISCLIIFFAIAYILNRSGYYNISAILLVVSAAGTPWVSLIFDPAILQGDFVPLTYLAFSILLSSILLQTYITIVLAVIQITGLTLVLLFCPANQLFNWFSFLAFVVLTSVFSILANSIIQSNMRQIESQAQQLKINEAHLLELSIRDHLTNLFNRRYLEETLEREIQRAVRTQQPLGVILLDVDNFKHINDVHGHTTGDIVLQEIGKYLASQVRQSDIACRYGGDEFVLILPDTSQGSLKERAELLRDGAKNLSVKNEDQITITLSLGVAVFPNDGSKGEAILRSADTALYQAKREGSDRVIMAS